MATTNPQQDSIDVLCHQCGKTFSAFLHQMADKNAKVVCPDCRENSDCGPTKTTKSGTVARKLKKIQ